MEVRLLKPEEHFEANLISGGFSYEDGGSGEEPGGKPAEHG